MKNLLAGERLPAALVDLDAFDENLKKLVAISGGKKIRIATKSIRVPELIERALKFGPPFSGVMCFSAEEAAFLAGRGIDDILVAYPTLQAPDLRALKEVHGKGRISLVVDSVEGLNALAKAMRGVSKPFRVIVEVDMSLRFFGIHLGVRRSPIRSIEDLKKFSSEISKYPELTWVGVMAYEAQIAGLGDRNPFKKLLNPIAHLIRKISVRAVRKRRQEIAHAFPKLEIFNGGGTGSFDSACDENWLTEVTAGSALLSSHLFDYYSNIRFQPSCFFALQVARSSDPGFFTLQGGGYIASGEPGWDKVPRPVSDSMKLVSTEGCGEVQTPIRTSEKLVLGEPVFFRPAKAGELAERFNEYILFSKGKIVSRAKTYRGFGLCFF